MKRTHSDDDLQIVEDSSLDSQCRSDNDENGSAKKPRDEVEERVPTEEVQTKETAVELCDPVSAESAEIADESATGSRCEDDGKVGF